MSTRAEPPREGLPPCWRGVARFDDREATWHDEERCEYGHGELNVVLAGAFKDYIKGFFYRSGDCSGGLIADGYPKYPIPIHIRTNDPAEAEAAFKRGEYFVRTGELE